MNEDHLYYSKYYVDDELFQNGEYFIDENDFFISNRFDSKLIKTIKQHPCLYINQRIKSPRDTEIVDAWNTIATNLGKSVKSCQSRWRRLRQYYAKERGKRESNLKRRRKWALYDEMNFLAPYMLKRRSFRRPTTQIIVKCQDPLTENAENFFFNDYFDMQLLEAIKNHPAIYNQKEKKESEIQAWNAVSSELDGHPIEDCQIRYKRLRQYYSKERAKKELYGNEYKKWMFYDLMNFMDPFIKKRITYKHLSQNYGEYYLLTQANDFNNPEEISRFENFYVSEDFDLKLIKALEKNPCIYNPELKKNENCEIETWKKISTEVDQPVEICQCRYVRLRQHYAKEREKMETSENYKQTWALYDHMSFLDPFIKRRKPSDKSQKSKVFREKLIATQKLDLEKPARVINSIDSNETTENTSEIYSNLSLKDDFNVSLLEAIKLHPCIYDVKKRISRECVSQAWNEIALKLKISTITCKQKFVRLRQYYAKERLKRIKNKPHREWRLYKTMDFLSPFIKTRNTSKKKQDKELDFIGMTDSEKSSDRFLENSHSSCTTEIDQRSIINNADGNIEFFRKTDNHANYNEDKIDDYNSECLSNVLEHNYLEEDMDYDYDCIESDSSLSYNAAENIENLFAMENESNRLSINDHKNSSYSTENENHCFTTNNNENSHSYIEMEDNFMMYHDENSSCTEETEKNFYILNNDENSKCDIESSDQDYHLNLKNSENYADKEKFFPPNDKESIKTLISATVADETTSFYWPDFTMTVIKKKKKKKLEK